MFFEGIRSERKLIETVSLNLAHRWYLGYALDEDLPDHSSLTRIRQRLGLDVFQRFFEQVVDLCQDAGLVWGQELYVDATKVEANADLDSLVPRFYHDAKTMSPISSPTMTPPILPRVARISPISSGSRVTPSARRRPRSDLSVAIVQHSRGVPSYRSRVGKLGPWQRIA